MRRQPIGERVAGEPPGMDRIGKADPVDLPVLRPVERPVIRLGVPRFGFVSPLLVDVRLLVAVVHVRSRVCGAEHVDDHVARTRSRPAGLFRVADAVSGRRAVGAQVRRHGAQRSLRHPVVGRVDVQPVQVDAVRIVGRHWVGCHPQVLEPDLNHIADRCIDDRRRELGVAGELRILPHPWPTLWCDGTAGDSRIDGGDTGKAGGVGKVHALPAADKAIHVKG